MAPSLGQDSLVADEFRCSLTTKALGPNVFRYLDGLRIGDFVPVILQLTVPRAVGVHQIFKRPEMRFIFSLPNQ